MQFAKRPGMSLSEATRPLLVISRLVGINPKFNWHKIHTVFILVCEIIVISYVWQYYIGLKEYRHYFKVLVYALEDSCRIASIVVILGQNLFDRKRYMVPSDDLVSVDESLHSFSGSIDNRGTYRFQILLVIYVGMLISAFGIVKFSLYTLPEYDDSSRGILLCHWSFCLVTLVLCALVDTSYASTLSVIRRRFKEINSIINRAQQHGSYLGVNLLEVSSSRINSDVLTHLRILRKQYHNLWRIANRVNEAYGPHLLLGATTSLALITSHLWLGYTTFVSSDRIQSHITVDGIIWASFYVARMFLLVKASESTVAEAQAAAVRLQELGMNGDHDPATKDEIRNFLTQLQLEPVKFSASGFFDVNYTLICGILGASCTYLVILIQMSDSKVCSATDSSNESIHFDYASEE